jgi:hypothetical protein
MILAAASIAGSSAHAADRPGQRIKSCSAYGNGCVTAPVRKGRFGPETRLPSGTWIDCRGDCREAIRQDLLDFWETQSDKALIIRR